MPQRTLSPPFPWSAPSLQKGWRRLSCRRTMAVSRPLSKRKLLPEAHGYSASPKDGESISGPSVPPPPEAKQSKPSTTDGGHSSSSCPPTPPRAEPPTPPRNKTKAKAFSTATSCTTSAAGWACSASWNVVCLWRRAHHSSYRPQGSLTPSLLRARLLRGSTVFLDLSWSLRCSELVDLVRRNMRDYTSKDDSKEKRASCAARTHEWSLCAQARSSSGSPRSG